MDLNAWIEKPQQEEKPKEKAAEETKPSESGTPNSAQPAPSTGTPNSAQPTTCDSRFTHPWFEKYRPKTLDAVGGNPKAVDDIKRWAEAWKTRKRGKPLILYGNTGVAKTTIAYALASDYDWEVMELNASDERKEAIINKVVGFGSQSLSITGKARLVLIEEIEGISGRRERGAAKAIAKIAKESKVPIIITTNDIKDKNLSPVKRSCEKIGVKKVSPATMSKILAGILKKEGIDYEEESLDEIAKNADGDLKAAINDLEAMACGREKLLKEGLELSKRNRNVDVFKALQSIFKSTDYGKCRRVLWDLNEEPRNTILWLDENVSQEYKKKEELSMAHDNLSRADIFLGRIMNRQYWGFLRYVNDLMSVGVGFAKEKPYYGFNKYRFPSYIQRMGSTRGKRAMEKRISGKIAPVVHSSARDIIVNYLPILRRALKRNPAKAKELTLKFELEEEETGFLMS